MPNAQQISRRQTSALGRAAQPRGLETPNRGLAIPALLLAGGFALVAAAPAAAQKQATTIEQLSRRAPLVLRIRVTQNRAVGRRIELRFAVLESLRGKLGVDAKLQEPLQRHCGSACHGLSSGQELVLFGQVTRGRLRPIGGSRGLVHVGLGELAEIRKLLAERDAAKRLAIVTAQLQHRSARVAEDASLALSQMPGLEKASAALKARVRVALQRSLNENGIQVYGLLTAAMRSEPAHAAEAAWSLVLETKRRGLTSLGRRVLLKEIASEHTLSTAPLSANAASSRTRVARVLAELATPKARSALETLARDRIADVRNEALIGLLGLGLQPAGLARSYDEREIQTALAERRQRQSKRFRAIKPQR